MLFSHEDFSNFPGGRLVDGRLPWPTKARVQTISRPYETPFTGILYVVVTDSKSEVELGWWWFGELFQPDLPICLVCP